MTPAFTARRRAEVFDALVETHSTGALDGADRTSPDPRFADLLQVVGALRAAPAPAPRPEFVADLRSRLMIEAETALEARPHATALPTPERTRTRTRERRVATAIGGFAIVSATASMAVAAQSALPGDTLYPLKRGIENAQVQVHSSDDGRGAALLEHAAGRLDEVGELSRDGGGDASDISLTLDDFSAQAMEASELLLDDYDDTGRVASLEELRAFTADSLDSLEGLQGLVPTGARDALDDAARTVALIDEQAKAACPTCTDAPAAVSPLFADAASVPGALDDLTGPPRPARGESTGQGGNGGTGPVATPPASPDPAPGDGATSPPSEPSLPAAGGSAPPPTTGDGDNGPIDDFVEGITGGGSAGSGGGAGTGTSGGTGGGTGGGAGRGTDTSGSNGTGLDELTAGLGDLLGG